MCVPERMIIFILKVLHFVENRVVMYHTVVLRPLNTFDMFLLSQPYAFLLSMFWTTNAALPLRNPCWIPGHASKNSGGQLSSYLRTLWYGSYFVDMVQAREMGLPPAALGREQPMSDRHQALLMNPFFLVREADSSQQFVFNIF